MQIRVRFALSIPFFQSGQFKRVRCQRMRGSQCDKIGRNFAGWARFSVFGHFFLSLAAFSVLGRIFSDNYRPNGLGAQRNYFV
jgi:hypothetical protein